MKHDESTGACIIYVFLLLAFAISVMFIPDAGAQGIGIEPVFWYRCDCILCRYVNLQGHTVTVFWHTWLRDVDIYGIVLDCRGSRYPDCHNCWSIHDARRWER